MILVLIIAGNLAVVAKHIHSSCYLCVCMCVCTQWMIKIDKRYRRATATKGSKMSSMTINRTVRQSNVCMTVFWTPWGHGNTENCNSLRYHLMPTAAIYRVGFKRNWKNKKYVKKKERKKKKKRMTIIIIINRAYKILASTFFN